MRSLPVVTEQAVSRIRVERSRLDQKFERDILQSDLDVKCRKGCHHCCYHPVQISLFEGVLLYWHLRNNGKWDAKLRFSLESHVRDTTGLSTMVWMLSEIACPLLVEGECSAYEARPMLCRSIYAVSLPDSCHPARFAQARIVNRFKPMAEFYEVERRHMKPLGMRHWVMPLSLAVLVGSRIATGELTTDEAVREAAKVYVEGANAD